MSSESPDRVPLSHSVPPAPVSESGETKRDQSSSSGTPDHLASFLAPAIAADELGWLAHYRVRKTLGRGGMGIVFEAEDTHLQRIVALKVIVPEFASDPNIRERFLREARAGAALKNDHVVTIYQVGQDRDIPYLAMEFLEGQSLQDRLNASGRLPAAEVVRIGRQVANGLAAAHAAGMIHRDVKPANVWLEARTGRAKLLDFGLARLAGGRSDLTEPGAVAGTPDYMSPEQAEGAQLDARSDLFSLGGVLYTLCTGQMPFQGSSTMAVLRSLALTNPRPVRELNADVPPALSELIMNLLEKDPAKRPASAEVVEHALGAIEGCTPDADSRHCAPVISPCPPRRRTPAWLVPASAVGGIVLLGLAAFLLGWFGSRPGGGATGTQPVAPSGPPIRIGVLHSRSGTMAISERPVIDAIHLAVDEINEKGGLLGRPIQAVVADGGSDETLFARQAEKLIREDQVCTIFGCWTSASRKAVVPVVEKHDHLLIYSVQYEGVEQSANVIYLGLVPNQQILPALRWLVGFENKKKWFLVGSDYVFPVTANTIIRHEAKERGCEIVGEEYLLLAATDVAEVVKKIGDAKPELIVNTINGDTNVAFFRALRKSGVTAKQTPTLSFSISEQEMSALGPGATTGDYVAADYFQSIDTPGNRELIRRFGARFGEERVISSAMETSYTAVHLWANAVKAAGSADTAAIRNAIKGQAFASPQGSVRIDAATMHMVQTVRVGRVNDAGRLVEVYVSPQPIVPEPFPPPRSRKEWGDFLDNLHERWGGRWSNPGP